MKILVREEDLKSADNYDLVFGVIDFVNTLLDANYLPEEIPAEAFYSYYVDYYFQQTRNGGISQFVYNTNWHPQVVEFVQNGLRAIKADENAELFSKISAFVASVETDLNDYLNGEYFDSPNDLRSLLDGFNDEFDRLQEKEDLIQLNHNFISSLLNIEVLADADYGKKLENLADSAPDKENRLLQAEENEPPHLKIIKKLCESAGQELVSLNAGVFADYNGEKVFEHHISTSVGHHYVVILEKSAILFDGTTQRSVSEIAI